MKSIHKILIVIEAAGCPSSWAKPIRQMLQWLQYEKHPNDFAFVMTRADSGFRDAKERLQREVECILQIKSKIVHFLCVDFFHPLFAESLELQKRIQHDYNVVNDFLLIPTDPFVPVVESCILS
jgi:hypothetical protein